MRRFRALLVIRFALALAFLFPAATGVASVAPADGAPAAAPAAVDPSQDALDVAPDAPGLAYQEALVVTGQAHWESGHVPGALCVSPCWEPRAPLAYMVLRIH